MRRESPTATGARGFTTGRLYTRDGVHVVSVAQEGPPSASDDKKAGRSRRYCRSSGDAGASQLMRVARPCQ
jgi:hypothetical protein